MTTLSPSAIEKLPRMACIPTMPSRAATFAQVLPLPEELLCRKLTLVSIYASQHGRPPMAARFAPSTAGYPGPHEAVWRIVG
jgi:hypothetical protein